MNINENKLGEFGKQFLLEATRSDTGSIDIIYMMGYIHIQIGSSVAHKIDSLEEDGENKLKNTLYQLEQLNLIKYVGNEPKSYKITDLGKEYAKTLKED